MSKKGIYFLLITLLFACNNLVEKPDHLISKSDMIIILIDLSLNDQSAIVDRNADLEVGTRYVLKKHNVEPDQFINSFEYYIINKSLPGIIEDAQKQLKEEYPQLKERLDNINLSEEDRENLLEQPPTLLKPDNKEEKIPQLDGNQLHDKRNLDIKK